MCPVIIHFIDSRNQARYVYAHVISLVKVSDSRYGTKQTRRDLPKFNVGYCNYETVELAKFIARIDTP